MNFIGANRELKEFAQSLPMLEKNSLIKNYCMQNKIEWQFILSRSPHQGGLCESTVKSAKRLIQRVIGSKNLTFEQTSTIFCQVEAVLISRPLTPLSLSQNDLQILTPGYFLIGASPNAVPQQKIFCVPTNILNKYHMLQQMVQHFWQRWSLEYLTTLQQRNKWHDTPTINVGDMVVLKEDNTHSCEN
ncbi:uncharacterized protein LOC126738766 [Anthonomus grandis grandis]|uniref:uncharacterized protein LOC126738766 n=1 Tax=Anthonomus grandis grandis TaxID=2921223 RepID=UPI0021661120|nr:uncharacterized protein LOC126738766 [Anthonomus grandis grandis]